MKALSMVVLVVGALAMAAEAGIAPVVVTGQSSCLDESGEPISCSGTGLDGEIQAGVSWPSPRFTDNGDGTVTDNLTRLIWLKDADCFGSQLYLDEALEEIEVFNGGSTGCEGYVAGTFDDWRLPNIRELSSLVDYGRVRPPLPATHPFVNLRYQGSGYGNPSYWSSTISTCSPGFTCRLGWQLVMDTGSTHPYHGGSDPSSNPVFVWPVRSGLLFADEFWFGDLSAWSVSVP